MTLIQKATPTSFFPIDHEIIIFSTLCIHQSLEPREKNELFSFQHSMDVVFYCMDNPLMIMLE